VTRIMFNSP